MFIDELFGCLRVGDRDVSHTFTALVVDKLKDIDEVIAVLVALPENLQEICCVVTFVVINRSPVWPTRRLLASVHLIE